MKIFLKLLEFYCCCRDFISHVIGVTSAEGPQTLRLMDKAKMPHAARTGQSEGAMRCPRTKVQLFQHHLVYNCPGHCVLSPELRSQMRHSPFYCALLLLHVIFISFEGKDLKSQSVTFWKYLLGIGRQWNKSCFLLSTDDLPQWQESKFGAFVETQVFLVSHSFIWSKEGVKSGYLGVISELKLPFWVIYQGGEHRKLSTVCGCSSISPPQVLN